MKKKPSSAKRNIQLQAFSPFASCKRLNCIQSVLDTSSNKEDSILVILGIDSRYNEGCRELANYLLFGFYDLRMAQFEESGIPEEDLDDLIILIRKTSVAVYCSSVLHRYLLPYIAPWRNLEVFCLSEEELEEVSDEEREEFKIKSFVSMLHGSRRIAIPYHSNTNIGVLQPYKSAQEFDKFAIEKWPLIQSYALEGIGGGSFFTMQYEASDIRNLLLPVYNACDPAALEQMLIKSLPLFERHWEEFLCSLSGTTNRKHNHSQAVILDVSEREAAESLLSYYKHGRLSATFNQGRENVMTPCSVQPYVRFGINTNDLAPGKETANATLRNTGSKDTNALHMVICSVAPRRPISCIRTYFVSPTDSSRKKDLHHLIRLYDACVEACQLAIKCYCSELNNDKALLACREAVLKRCSSQLHGGAVSCKLDAFDSSGRSVTLTAGKPSYHVKTMAVSVDGVKSLMDGSAIGSVSYSDTFIESTIKTVETGGNTKAATDWIVLTTGILRFIQWNASEEKAEADSELVGKLSDVYICSQSPLLAGRCCCDAEFYEDKSVILSSAHFPAFIIPSDALEGYSCYDNGLPNALPVLSFNFKPSNSVSFLKSLQKYKLSVTIFPQTIAAKTFTTKVRPFLEELQKSSSLKFVVLNDVEEELSSSYDAILAHYRWCAGFSYRGNIEVKSSKLTKSTSSLQPQLTDFMKRFQASFVLDGKSVPEDDIEGLLGQESVAGNGDTSALAKQDAKVCVTVVLSLPGCHGDRLCASLVSLHRERVRWVVVQVQCKSNDATMVDEEHLQIQLRDFVAKRRTSRPGAATTKRLRIIVEATGFFDVSQVVSCIFNHKDASTRENMYIGAVTVCVDPLATYIEHRRMLPKVLEQCTAGMVNCVAFTGALEDLKDKNLALMQSVIRDVNPNAAFLLADGGKTSRSSDFDLVLSESEFGSEANRSLRHLSTPGIWNGSFDIGRAPIQMQLFKLDFSQLVIKGTISAKLRALHNSLRSYPFNGNVYMVKGVVAFTESPEQEVDLCFVSTTCRLVLEARTQPQVKAPAPPKKNAPASRPYHLQFYGVDLEESNLRDWLRKCGRQKPSKKCHKTKATLSQAERKRLQTLHQNDPLPDGIYFNGTQYCSLLDNSRLYEHPCLDQIIDQHMKQQNEEIDQYNQKIASQTVADMFD